MRFQSILRRAKFKTQREAAKPLFVLFDMLSSTDRACGERQSSSIGPVAQTLPIRMCVDRNIQVELSSLPKSGSALTLLRRSKVFCAAILLFLSYQSYAKGQGDSDLLARQHFEAARQAEKSGDLDKAAAEYAAILATNPDVAEVRTNLGLIYYRQGKNDAAVKAFEQALQSKPDLLGATLFLGMAYVRVSQYKLAIEPLKKVISLNPRELKAYLNLALCYTESDQQEQALEILQKAEHLFPQDVEVLYELGRVYSDLMTKTYEKMDQVDPDSYRMHQLIGSYYEARRDTQAALEEYVKAIEKRPDAPDLHYALGSIYWKELKFEKAKSEFEHELQLAPENYLATWKLGNIYLSERKYDLAFRFLNKALQQKPNLAQAHRDLGRALFQTGDYEGAISHLKTIAHLSPDESTAHYLMAQAYRKLGKTKEQNAELELFGVLREAEQKRILSPASTANDADPSDEKLDQPPTEHQ